MKRILRYLRGTPSHGLHFTRNSSFALHSFTDADWACSIEDKKYTGGYLVFFGQTPILWKSSKQRTAACSSMEAEYKTLADGTPEVIWLQYLLTDLQILVFSAYFYTVQILLYPFLQLVNSDRTRGNIVFLSVYVQCNNKNTHR